MHGPLTVITTKPTGAVALSKPPVDEQSKNSSMSEPNIAIDRTAPIQNGSAAVGDTAAVVKPVIADGASTQAENAAIGGSVAVDITATEKPRPVPNDNSQIEDSIVNNKPAAEKPVPVQEGNAAAGDAPVVSKLAGAAQDGNVVVEDETAVAQPAKPQAVADSLAKEKPAEIVAQEAEAEAKVEEPPWAPLKAMGEKKVSNNLADYGDYYRSPDR